MNWVGHWSVNEIILLFQKNNIENLRAVRSLLDEWTGSDQEETYDEDYLLRD